MKKMLKRFGYALLGVSVLCLAAISCSSPTGSDSPDPDPQNPSSGSGSEPGVYIGGGYLSPGYCPCYWKDGELIELSTHGSNYGSGHVGACFNDNGTIRFAGSRYKSLSLWADRYRTDWRNPYVDNTVVVKAMFVRGSDTYVVGQVGFAGVYWKNGVGTTWISGSSTGTTSGVLEGIYVDEDLNTHICGTKNYNTPVYWKNTTEYVLQTDNGFGEAHDITMAGGRAYIVGRCSNGVDRYIACYWVDGVRYELDTAVTDSSCAMAIHIAGADVYIGGYYYPKTNNQSNDDHACYWKNGVRVDLPGRDTYVSDIVVSSGKVYACGNGDSTILISQQTGCYWIDGARYELTAWEDEGVSAKCIVVK